MKFEIGRLIDVCGARALVQPADAAVVALGLTSRWRLVLRGILVP